MHWNEKIEGNLGRKSQEVRTCLQDAMSWKNLETLAWEVVGKRILSVGVMR